MFLLLFSFRSVRYVSERDYWFMDKHEKKWREERGRRMEEKGRQIGNKCTDDGVSDDKNSNDNNTCKLIVVR